MTDRARRRTSFTQAELARAIRAADTVGKVAIQTPVGIAYLDPESAHKILAPGPSAPLGSRPGVISCDELFPRCD